MQPSDLPTLFVPHGAPTFALQPGQAGAALRRVASTLPRPRAIVMVSPHWVTPGLRVGAGNRLETIHDFEGFPDELYAIRYLASGCPEAAREVIDALEAAHFSASRDAERGLDHGAWVPLRLMFPEADVPIVPVSVQSDLGPQHAYGVGRALAPLAQQGFLVIGSGSITHNLRDFQYALRNGGKVPEYVPVFADWIAARMADRDLPALLDYRNCAPGAIRAHPTEEHLLPLFTAMGAASEGAQANRFHAGIDDYVLAMDAYAFR